MFTKKLMVLLECDSRLIVKKRLKWTSENVKLFAALYDMPLNQWKSYRREKKIPALTSEHIRSTVAFRKSVGVSSTEWLKYPILLKATARSLEQQYLQLKEGGFTCVNAGVLAHYRKFIRNKISFLKLHNFIKEDVNVAESFISYLNPKPNNFAISDLTDDQVFEDIHHSVLTRYIMWRCEATQDEVEKFYRIYKLGTTKSFDFLCQNFAIAEDLGFSPKKILKNGYLLINHPQNTNTVLTEMPTLAGMDIRKAMKMYPKLIGVQLNHYEEIYGYLKEVNVPDTTIQRCMNIFSLSPKTVKLRFEEIKSIPELRVLLNNPRALNLILHHNQARSRLSFLKQLNLKCATTATLATGHETFNMYVRGGKDLNNTNEVILFLKRLLKTESKLIEINLKKHQYFRHVPLVKIEESYEFLRNQEFTNQSITDVIQILLYPRYKISKAYQKLRNLEFLNERNLSLIEKLNLILYFLEKEHHFTGNGIWEDS